jgi:dynein assembly factor 1, axonemal
LIEQIEGLETLTDLVALNLSDNLITRVENLGALVKLETLQLKRNRIGKVNSEGEKKSCVEDLKGLLECPSLSVVDLSDNFIDDPEILPEILEKMPKLAVLYLQGNPVTRSIKNYRKTLISRIPTLKYLDDRPVFDEDRRFAEAWSKGGIEEERKERELLRKEKDDAHWKNHEAFKEMIRKAKEEKKKADEERQQQKALENGAPVVDDQVKPEEEKSVAPALNDHNK